MKVTFEWKSFLVDKPENGSKIIFKNNASKGELYIGVYQYDNATGEHCVTAGKLNLKSLSKKNSTVVKFTNYTLCNEWDYYTENWV